MTLQPPSHAFVVNAAPSIVAPIWTLEAGVALTLWTAMSKPAWARRRRAIRFDAEPVALDRDFGGPADVQPGAVVGEEVPLRRFGTADRRVDRARADPETRLVAADRRAVEGKAEPVVLGDEPGAGFGQVDAFEAAADGEPADRRFVRFHVEAELVGRGFHLDAGPVDARRREATAAFDFDRSGHDDHFRSGRDRAAADLPVECGAEEDPVFGGGRVGGEDRVPQGASRGVVFACRLGARVAGAVDGEIGAPRRAPGRRARPAPRPAARGRRGATTGPWRNDGERSHGEAIRVDRELPGT